jgi:hypothetical protein
MIWQPRWSLCIGTLESLLALSLLIVTMGVRVMTMSEQMLKYGSGLVTKSEIMNFMIVSFVAYFAYERGMQALRKDSGIKW